MLAKDRIRRILQECGEDRSQDRIAAEMEHMADIESDMHSISRRERELTKEYEDKKRALEKERSSVRKRCKHWVTRYYGDAAGGSDSLTVCEICGAEAHGNQKPKVGE